MDPIEQFAKDLHESAKRAMPKTFTGEWEDYSKEDKKDALAIGSEMILMGWIKQEIKK